MHVSTLQRGVAEIPILLFHQMTFVCGSTWNTIQPIRLCHKLFSRPQIILMYSSCMINVNSWCCSLCLYLYTLLAIDLSPLWLLLVLVSRLGPISGFMLGYEVKSPFKLEMHYCVSCTRYVNSTWRMLSEKKYAVGRSDPIHVQGIV